MTSDRGDLFIGWLIATWLLFVAVPICVSVVMGTMGYGLPLALVLIWFIFLRGAQILSPSVRADRLMRNGHYARALELCDRALAQSGKNAWQGNRRMVWYNRRVSALLGLGKVDDALSAALEAVNASPDSQTLGNLSLVLLRLNRYDEAEEIARGVLALTRERSIIGNVVLAGVKLKRGLPADADSLARTSLADVRQLLPNVRPEHHVACLAVMCRAARAQGQPEIAEYLFKDLKNAAGSDHTLQSVAVLEEIENLPDTAVGRDEGFQLLEEAYQLDPHYTLWQVTQPGTLIILRGDGRFVLWGERSTAEFAEFAAIAPSREALAEALSGIGSRAQARPIAQANTLALGVQLATLGGTLVLLLWWTWRFFLIG